MGITDFEFKTRGLLEEKMTKYRNSVPRKAVVELIERVCQTYTSLQERSFNPPINVGDLLYPICYDHVANEWLIDNKPERVIETGINGFFLASCLQYPDDPDEYHLYDEIGKKFFLTREEAEAAVAKLMEEQDHEEE